MRARDAEEVNNRALWADVAVSGTGIVTACTKGLAATVMQGTIAAPPGGKAPVTGVKHTDRRGTTVMRDQRGRHG
jgi:hypothetical protein